MSEFYYQKQFPLTKDTTRYKKISDKFVKLESLGGREILKVEDEALRLLTEAAFKDIMHLLRPAHMEKLSKILADEEASENDYYVATTLIENAMIAAEMIYPGCQDTGTAIVMGKKGENVWSEGDDKEFISRGVFDAYQNNNFRYSQVAPLSIFEEKKYENKSPGPD